MLLSDISETEYHSYHQPYIDALGEVELLDGLKTSKRLFMEFIEQIPDSKKNFSYGEGKWTVAEVLQHIIDAERVFQYRAFRFSREDLTPLPGFDQDNYVPKSRANEKSFEEIVNEFSTVRDASISLFSTLTHQELKRKGIATDATMSVRALGFIISGHLEHHKCILRERYLS